MICYNPNITFSRYESIDERLEQILRYCASIDYKDGHYSLLPYNLQINIPELLSYNATDSFIGDYIEKSETIKKQGLSFKDIISKDLFSLDSSKSLKIPVGVGDGDSIINITIGEGSSHHGLIAGATGSGKSTLLHTLIMSSMLHYSPDQLHLYLMDFKSGTEFKIYESVKLPHIQLLALDAMQEFGESILENLVAEMEHRGSLFKEAGQTSLKGYTQATGQTLPRIALRKTLHYLLKHIAHLVQAAVWTAGLDDWLADSGLIPFQFCKAYALPVGVKGQISTVCLYTAGGNLASKDNFILFYLDRFDGGTVFRCIMISPGKIFPGRIEGEGEIRFQQLRP